MNRIVLCDSPEIDLNREYEQCDIYTKPDGLWYANGYEWKDWVFENMGWSYPYEFSIEVNLDSLVRISTINDLISFTERFEVELIPSINQVNWEEVTKYYSGIEVTNYWEIKSMVFRQCNLSLLWFNMLDCNSGCIWDLKSIKSYEQRI